MRNVIEGNIYQCKIELNLLDRLVLISGDSGVGKSLIYQYLEDISRYSDKSYECINIETLCKEEQNSREDFLLKRIKACDNKVIVIDNADTILQEKTRTYIARDTKNQYIIFGRNVAGLFITENKVAELVLDNNVFKLNYTLK